MGARNKNEILPLDYSRADTSVTCLSDAFPCGTSAISLMAQFGVGKVVVISGSTSVSSPERFVVSMQET